MRFLQQTGIKWQAVWIISNLLSSASNSPYASAYGLLLLMKYKGFEPRAAFYAAWAFWPSASCGRYSDSIGGPRKACFLGRGGVAIRVQAYQPDTPIEFSKRRRGAAVEEAERTTAREGWFGNRKLSESFVLRQSEKPVTMWRAFCFVFFIFKFSVFILQFVRAGFSKWILKTEKLRLKNCFIIWQIIIV